MLVWTLACATRPTATMRRAYAVGGYGAFKAYEMILGEGLWEGLRDNIGAAACMIRATYTPNFHCAQDLMNSIFAESHDPAGLPAAVQRPRLTEDAAANQFAQIDKEWLRKIFANPVDETRIQDERANKPLKDVITAWSKTMRGLGIGRHKVGRDAIKGSADVSE